MKLKAQIVTKLKTQIVMKLKHSNCDGTQNKLDGVGPVDNRPSIDMLHFFVKKKHTKRHVTCDMWHVTHDT